MSSKLRHDGELEVDCRASPGIPEEIAVVGGLPKIRQGSVYHCATMTCFHCGTAVIVNELRVRPREYCRTCDAYICDFCHARRSEADYVHRSFKDLVELVKTGRYILSGPAHRIELIPILKET